jgi:hypothetical protein
LQYPDSMFTRELPRIKWSYYKVNKENTIIVRYSEFIYARELV